MNSQKSELIIRIMELRSQFGRYLHDNQTDAWLALNVTIAQLKSLMFINQQGSTNFKILARALRVSPPNVTGIVDRLVDQELVTREDNPDNRRMQVLKVTAKGASLISELMESGESRLFQALASMKTGDLQDLSNGLNALISAARQNQKNNADSEVEKSESGQLNSK